MRHIDEDAIKKAGIRFLKDYYKYRPRTGNTITSTDQETKDGIITDCLFTFINEDGNPFLSTLEATSYETKEEVFYKKQKKLLFWDSLVWSSILAVVFFSLSHYYSWITINKNGWLITLSVLALIIIIGFYFIETMIASLQRYRYIYAVEQFKKYHADEQWIAIADDVFDESTDKYYEELKNQCVRNGFGLISVDQQEIARIIITPSRQEIFGKSRKNKAFYNRDEYLIASKTERIKTWWNKILASISGKRSDTSVFRYQRTYTSQIFLGLIALLILAGIFYKEAQNAPVSYVNEKEYEKQLTEKTKKAKPETSDFIVDSAYVDRDKKPVQPYLENVKEELPTDLSEKDWDSIMAEYFEDYGEQYAEIYIASMENKFLSYDCERFFNYSGTKYLLQEKTYSDVNEARKQLIRLKKQGINANCLWTGCLNENDMEFIIFIDFLFDNKKEAGLILTNLKRRFKLEKGLLKIRSITL